VGLGFGFICVGLLGLVVGWLKEGGGGGGGRDVHT